MRYTVMSIAFVLHCFVAGGQCHLADIQGKTLVKWPRDFNGVAVVPSGVRHIGINAFTLCKFLTGVVLPESVETIGHFAFNNCVRLREVQIPESVTNVGNYAFAHCQSLTSLVMRAKIEKIPEGMCVQCCSLKRVELPAGIAEIGKVSFCGCRSIRNMRIPESVKHIGSSAFHGCCRIRCMFLPKNIRTIDKFAFSRCSDMRYLVVPPDLKIVGENAFQDCLSLKGIISLGGVPNLDEWLLPNADETCTVFAVACKRDVFDESRHDCHVDCVKSLEKAIAVCEKQDSKKSFDNIFEGLDLALRIAAESLLKDIADTNVSIWKLDGFIAHFPRLKEMKSVDDIKEYLAHHSTTSIDIGERMTAYFCILDDISIIADFKENRLTRLALSEGLRKAVRKGLEVGADSIGTEKVDGSVLRWLE